MEYGLRLMEENNMKKSFKMVLILVVMEYGLRQLISRAKVIRCSVLILVVMEYGLRRIREFDGKFDYDVLILVVMEYGLRQNKILQMRMEQVLILVVMEYGLRQCNPNTIPR